GVGRRLRTAIVVDSRAAGAHPPTSRDDALLVIGLWPGFSARQGAHVVVDARPGPNLGRVYWEGSTAPEGNLPAPGPDVESLVRAPVEGLFAGQANIGDTLLAGGGLGNAAGAPVGPPVRPRPPPPAP